MHGSSWDIFSGSTRAGFVERWGDGDGLLLECHCWFRKGEDPLESSGEILEVRRVQNSSSSGRGKAGSSARYLWAANFRFCFFFYRGSRRSCHSGGALVRGVSTGGGRFGIDSKSRNTKKSPIPVLGMMMHCTGRCRMCGHQKGMALERPCQIVWLQRERI